MSADFVPFLSGIRSRMTGASSPNGTSLGAGNGFAPMTPKPPTVAAPDPAHPPPPVAQQAQHPCAPARDTRVEVKRSGDRITHIQVTCKCGEVIEIECEY